ncbi:antitoxin phd [Candidatus Termititenax aidoneus]|uniref:Antitoxin phd n=1 Tax=Termititenax aidoneus TaxID=2218524 RepID=A0A388TCY2_TERA1|nr:antitoxin phd [Candidatus Termititenax aidoneus]
MPQIIPIKDLKNTSAIAQMCQEATEPIYITKNGYSSMVIMSSKMYEERMFLQDVYCKLTAAEEQIAQGKTLDAGISLEKIKAKFKL